MQKKKFVLGGVVAAALALAAMPALAQNNDAESQREAAVSAADAASPRSVSPADAVSPAGAASPRSESPADAASPAGAADTANTSDVEVAVEAQSPDSSVVPDAQPAVGDSVKPTATLVTPTSRAAQKSSTVDIQVDAADEGGLARITANVYKDGALVKSTSTAAAGATSGSHKATVELPEGDYTIRYNATDLAGNVASTGQFPVSIDQTRPTTTLVTPASAVVQKSGTVAIEVAAHDAHGLDRITANVYQDGVLFKSTSTAANGATSGSHKATVELPEGDYTIRYNSRDVAGNISTTRELPVTIDQTRPSVELVTPTADMVSGLDIEVAAQDPHGLDRITANIYKDGVLFKSTSTGVNGVNRGSHTATVDLPDGTYTIRYNARDVAGNVSSTGNFTVTLDSVAPTVTLKDGAQPGNKSFKLYDAGQIDRLTVNGVEKDLTNNIWSDLNGVRPGVFGAKEGQNTLVVFDRAGNRTTFEFVLDTVAPKVTDIEQVYQSKDGGRMAVTLTFSEPIATAPGQGWYGSGTTYTKVYYSSKSYTIAFSDVAGNAGSYTFTVDPIVAPVA